MRILFITSTRIGDAVLSSGLISYLSDRHPDARFTIVCGAPAAPLFEAVPRIEHLMAIRKRPLHGHWFALWAKCLPTRWDQIYDLRGSILSWFLIARERVTGRYRNENMHRVDELADLAGIFPPPNPTLWLSNTACSAAADLIPAEIPVLAVGPTANWGGKIWPADRFAELVSRVIDPAGLLPGARVAVLGHEVERKLAAVLLDRIPTCQVIDLIGKPLSIAAACIKQCTMYIGNDSGLMHIAAASGTPTLGLFGPSSEARYGPWGPMCATVRTTESYKELVGSPDFDHRNHQSLMRGLTVDAAHDALAKLYASVKYDKGRESV
ncbi:MAG: glycosyltransferase family 9 protein [Pseudomonadota bacterium]|nr:glycosyltransferase family 9 protein [Pseudomonadota bacterium]